MNRLDANRLKTMREALGISQSELARRSNSSQQTINRIEAGLTDNPRNILAIARALETSPEYLMRQTDDPTPSPASQEVRLAYRAQDPGEIAEQINSVLIPQLEIGYSMGAGSVFEDYQETTLVPFPREWLRPLMRGTFSDLFVARGQGDSMVPTLLDGDIVVVDTAQKRIDQQDRLWCISYGDLGMIKRVRILPSGAAQINSDNPAITPIEAHDNEMHVVGRVIWIARKV